MNRRDLLKAFAGTAIACAGKRNFERHLFPFGIDLGRPPPGKRAHPLLSAELQLLCSGGLTIAAIRLTNLSCLETTKFLKTELPDPRGQILQRLFTFEPRFPYIGKLCDGDLPEESDMGALGPSETRTFWTILEQSYLLLPSTMVRVSYRACHEGPQRLGDPRAPCMVVSNRVLFVA